MAEYVRCLLEAGPKFLLFFAYHLAVLDSLEAVLRDAMLQPDVGYIRIDGSTPMSERSEAVKNFQNEDGEVRVDDRPTDRVWSA